MHGAANLITYSVVLDKSEKDPQRETLVPVRGVLIKRLYVLSTQEYYSELGPRDGHWGLEKK